jgi:hypothetical protein
MVLVVVGTLLALLAGFRSLFAAVKAIALNLLSVAASCRLGGSFKLYAGEQIVMF